MEQTTIQMIKRTKRSQPEDDQTPVLKKGKTSDGAATDAPSNAETKLPVDMANDTRSVKSNGTAETKRSNQSKTTTS